jgi:hypothetical protein
MADWNRRFGKDKGALERHYSIARTSVNSCIAGGFGLRIVCCTGDTGANWSGGDDDEEDGGNKGSNTAGMTTMEM